VPASAVAFVAEDEGLSVVLEQADADARGLSYHFVAAWITLTVHSDLAAVGLTAAVSAALTEVGISANVIAGHHHDHLLVPVERSDEALAVLGRLSGGADSSDFVVAGRGPEPRLPTLSGDC
jgi:hypothetical protein